jgi:hypothetical protein
MSTDLFSPGIVISGACNGRETKDGKSDTALNWGEGFKGDCYGPYRVATTTAPFKGGGSTRAGVSWTARSAGGLDLSVSAYTTVGGLKEYGSISGWMSDRGSRDFHVTSADVGIWHADSAVTTPDGSGAAAGTRGGPLLISVRAYHEVLKPHIDVDIRGFLLYSTPEPPLEYHFFRVHFNGSCPEAYGIGTATCTGHYDEGSSSGFSDEDGTVYWQVHNPSESSRFVLQFKTSNGEVICVMGSRSSEDCEGAVRIDSLGAGEDIRTGPYQGGGPPGTPGGELALNAQGGGNLDLHGYLRYKSWVPPVWPPA